MHTAPIAPAQPRLSRTQVILLVAILAGIYIVSQFFRNAIGVIAPDLASELTLSASQIGLLSSLFFFAFAAAQIPLGVALDRYGAQACLLVLTSVAIAGTILFALATTPELLMAARALMGLGASCYLMAPLAIYSRVFTPQRFSTLVGIHLAVGNLGTLLATAPLAFAAAQFGWRNAFLAVAGWLLICGLSIFVVLRGKNVDRSAHAPTSVWEGLAGFGDVFKTPSVWRLFLMHLAGYSSFVLIIGLWGGPYLTHVYGFDLTQRGHILFLCVSIHIASLFFWGLSDRLFASYKRPVLIGSAFVAALLAVMAIVGVFPLWGLLAWFVALGVASAHQSVLIAHGKSLFEPALVGRGLTLMNVGTMGGGFLAQTVSGFVIDLFPAAQGAYPLAAYRTVFGLQAAFLVLAIVLYRGARDPRVRSESHAENA